ncbi:PREDICTED: uncharacterized protein LOC108578229 [Habropoda laboriosa]|uniref:uncharacterized protein LOC108578229 n=1 Tax=Habropoda laboriosa TaxID=597456 RepID=UPI00083CBA39|nr:PREDICTED: uncharacterized protein LOC108578229 [Habropoda laboriosa]
MHTFQRMISGTSVETTGSSTPTTVVSESVLFVSIVTPSSSSDQLKRSPFHVIVSMLSPGANFSHKALTDSAQEHVIEPSSNIKKCHREDIQFPIYHRGKPRVASRRTSGRGHRLSGRRCHLSNAPAYRWPTISTPFDSSSSPFGSWHSKNGVVRDGRV